MDRYASGTRPQRGHRAVKPRRSGRAPDDGGWRVATLHPSGPYGPDVTGPGLEEFIEAMASIPGDLSWAYVGDRIVPLFVRVRPYAPDMPEPLRTVVPPGVTVGFGFDIGPAFANVSAELLEGWAVTVGQLTEQALANLLRDARTIERETVRPGSVAGEQVDLLEADGGLASGLVLLPDQLERLFGPGPRLYVAPMRSVLLAFRGDVDRGLAAWIYAEIALQDPNCLAPQAFFWTGREMQVEPLGPPAAQA